MEGITYSNGRFLKYQILINAWKGVEFMNNTMKMADQGQSGKQGQDTDRRGQQSGSQPSRTEDMEA